MVLGISLGISLILFTLILSAAGKRVPEPVEAPSTDEHRHEPAPVRSEEEALARLAKALEGREAVMWLPQGLERRLRAQLHRLNANVAAAGWEQDAMFDPEDDIGCVLLTVAERGMAEFEQEDGVSYDPATGLPLDDLNTREET